MYINRVAVVHFAPRGGLAQLVVIKKLNIYL